MNEEAKIDRTPYEGEYIRQNIVSRCCNSPVSAEKVIKPDSEYPDVYLVCKKCSQRCDGKNADLSTGQNEEEGV